MTGTLVLNVSWLTFTEIHEKDLFEMKKRKKLQLGQ